MNMTPRGEKLLSWLSHQARTLPQTSANPELATLAKYQQLQLSSQKWFPQQHQQGLDLLVVDFPVGRTWVRESDWQDEYGRRNYYPRRQELTWDPQVIEQILDSQVRKLLMRQVEQQLTLGFRRRVEQRVEALTKKITS